MMTLMKAKFSPQRLGFLPTASFWRDRHTNDLAAPIIGLVGLPGSVALVCLDLPIWIYLVLTIIHPLLMMGLLERYVRVRAAARWRASLQ